jgi:hypothetical protein
MVATRARRSQIAVAGLLLAAAGLTGACGGSSTASPGAPATGTPTAAVTAVPQAAVVSTKAGTITSCGAVDSFFSPYTSGGTHYSVNVNLGKADCPSTGALGLSAEVAPTAFNQNAFERKAGGLIVGMNAGVAYSVPTSDVQATFKLGSPKGSSLVVVFNAQAIVSVTIMGTGAPEELTRG